MVYVFILFRIANVIGIGLKIEKMVEFMIAWAKYHGKYVDHLDGVWIWMGLVIKGVSGFICQPDGKPSILKKPTFFPGHSVLDHIT